MSNRERGNAVLFILIAICLLGALAYTFSSGLKTGEGKISKQQARITAQQLMDLGASMQRGVDQLMRKGCSENQINFAKLGSLTATGYTNADSPADKNCDVFEVEGASVAPITQDMLPPTKAGAAPNYLMRIHASSNVLDTPSDASDLVMDFSVNDEICKQINKISGHGEALTTNGSAIAVNSFTGSFSESAPASYNLSGIAGCVHVTTIGSTGVDENHFFYVLLPR